MGVTINTQSGYHNIVEHFQKLVDIGRLKPGDRLPSLPELCEQFGVSRATASRALLFLKTTGYVHSTTTGTFVLPGNEDKRREQRQKRVYDLWDKMEEILNDLEDHEQHPDLDVPEHTPGAPNEVAIFGSNGKVVYRDNRWQAIHEPQ